MNIVAFSDSHNRHKQLNLPDGDVIVCAGDITGSGHSGEVKAFVKWYSKLNYEHKILIAGNHDFFFESEPERAEKLCEDNGIIYLNDSGCEIDGFNFWGSPVQPWFFDWAFNRARNEAQERMYKVPLIKPHWDMIPDDTDVLITHGPAYGILDELCRVDGTPKRQFVGCEDLLETIKRIKPDVHICGHIHCGYGEKHIDGTSYYNVAVCDEMYYPSNSPKVIEIIKG